MCVTLRRTHSQCQIRQVSRPAETHHARSPQARARADRQQPRGHFEPRPSEAAPVVETLVSTLDEGKWVETSFVCYSCDVWAGNTLSSGTQPWIWAFNTAQSFGQATGESKLRMHHHYGSFSLQMTGHDQDATSERISIPAIDFSLPNQDSHGGNDPDRTAFGAWVPIHGSLLVLGMMIFFPCGAVAIRSGSKKSFKAHLYFQLAASVCCLVGAAVAMFSVGLNFSVGKQWTPDAGGHLSEGSSTRKLTTVTTIGRLVRYIAHAGRHVTRTPNPTAAFSGVSAPQSLQTLSPVAQNHQGPRMDRTTDCARWLSQRHAVSGILFIPTWYQLGVPGAHSLISQPEAYGWLDRPPSTSSS